MAILSKPIHMTILFEMIGVIWEQIQMGTKPSYMITRHTILEAQD